MTARQHVRRYATRAEAIQAEIIDQLNALGLGGDGTIEPAYDAIAARILVPLDAGYACMVSRHEFTRIVTDEVCALPVPEPFDCPISWCSADRYAHGADGTLPEDWRHETAPDDFAPSSGMFWGVIEQRTGLPPSYVLHAEPPTVAHYLDATEVRALADQFERNAELLRERAAQLDAIAGGAQ